MKNSHLKSIFWSIYEWSFRFFLKKEIGQLRGLLSVRSGEIPVVIVCYNNGKYVGNFVDQLSRFSIVPIVIDNASNDAATLVRIAQLAEGGRISLLRMRRNFGHKVGFLPGIYECLPEFFAYTDPDLALSEALPHDFLRQLGELTQQFKVYKAGLALRIPSELEIISKKYKKKKTKPIRFQREYSVVEWERQYWVKKLNHESLEVYAAPVDTTFAVYNKSEYSGDFFSAVRVGGVFSCIHIPWFPQLDFLTTVEREKYMVANKSSTWNV
jgi:glycosyltransferase involved in cell wall biosynthesis